MAWKQVAIATTALATLSFSALSLAGGVEKPAVRDAGGLYLMLQPGYGWDSGRTVYPERTVAGGLTLFPTSASTRDYDGFAGRVAVGYGLNAILAAEIGWAYYPSAVRQYVGNLSTGVAENVSQKVSENYYFDLMIRGNIPLGKFFAYVAGGFAVGHINYESINENSGNFYALNNIPQWVTGTDWNIRPKVAAGLGYFLMRNLSIGVSYSRVFGRSDSSIARFVPSYNLAAVDITYHLF